MRSSIRNKIRKLRFIGGLKGDNIYERRKKQDWIGRVSDLGVDLTESLPILTRGCPLEEPRTT